MKQGIVTAFVLLGCSWSTRTAIQQNFDRAVFYSIFANGDIQKIDAQIKVVQQSSFQGKDAFEGALLMKKASLVSLPGQKLSLFKSGHKKLEASINADEKNAEFRFLRLVIQENAPKFLNYHNNIGEDADLVCNAFNNFSAALQNAVKDYSKKSKVLHNQDFNN